MNISDDQGPSAVDIAAARVEEVVEIYDGIRAALRASIAEIGTPTSDTPKSILNRLTTLQAAHLQAVMAEQAYHALKKDSDADANIDYDLLRAELGRQLDRIRAARGTA